MDDATQGVPHPDLDVQTICLDDFAAQARLLPPTLLKFDIEGGEGEALRGARRVLREFWPVVICEIHGKPAGEVARGTLAEADYEIFLFEETFRAVEAEENLPPWCHVLACHHSQSGSLLRRLGIRPAEDEHRSSAAGR